MALSRTGTLSITSGQFHLFNFEQFLKAMEKTSALTELKGSDQ
jgi:hypothetical protein